ncbi:MULTISPECIES: HD domain-containing phosphohydrolase [unclassified Neptuniibacter]|uniref:HD domain-containing phosphohydrolase n=1 Tax=unclassified Neptuniibacter TaxID=2630693 RepID=UPI0025FC8236|nr:MULTISPECIES: HD domain-containing phosphohydrolase [unclassified Neptuniibacter]|tara:strand:- start:8899 stop:10680 length:1782 start_codon:yes stop_codon:yes gene_type:complete
MIDGEAKQLAHKKFWSAWVPLSFVGFIVIYLALYLLNDFQNKKTAAEIKVTLQQAEKYINEYFHSVHNDLQLLVNNPITEDFIDSQASIVEPNAIQSMFKSMAQSHDSYDQIRLLSKDGMELIRVDNKDGVVFVTSKEDLQNKSDRYYFKESLSLRQGEVYISRLDLNVENKVIEVPYEPVIRFVSPIVDSKRNVVAYIVINLLGNEVLSYLHEIIEAQGKAYLVLNSDGYQLHTSNEKESAWGFMFGAKENFAIRNPNIWSKILSADYGEFESDLGRIHYRVINKQVTNIRNRLEGTLNSWSVIVISNESWVSSEFFNDHLSYLSPLLLVFPFGAVLLWFWAKASAGRSLAEERLRNINVELENKVSVRTKELELTREATILSLATLAETRDNETGQHIRRTQRYAKLLAKELQAHPDFVNVITDDFINEIFRSAPLHDIGKVGIPDQILLKPGKLTEEEFKVMQQHTVLGSNALEEAIITISVTNPSSKAMTFLHLARDIAHYHHERWDGSGYPKGLAGESIPLCARIMAVVDVYDALVSKRVYKDAFTKGKAEKIILHESAGHFDPRVIKAFESIRDQFWKIRRNFSDIE